MNELNHQYHEPKEVQKPACNSNFSELFDFLNKNKLSNNPIKISIIIPVYNEEKSIIPLIDRLPKNDAIEIIFIDDHSTDTSVSEIEKAQLNRKINLIKHSTNKGYGGAILTGFKNAKGDVIVTLDSDGQHCPEDLFNMIKPIFNETADFTIGSRYLGKYYYTLPIKTRLGEAILESVIRLLFGPKIVNNQNGYRAYHKKMIHLIMETKFLDYAFATEIILNAAIHHYRIKEIPIDLHDRQYGKSKIKLHTLLLNLSACTLLSFLKKLKLKFKNEVLLRKES